MHGLTGGGWKRKRPATVTGVAQPTGNHGKKGPGTYCRPAPPRQPPTLHRTVVSSQLFAALDHYLWRLLYQWALRRHPNKGKRWVQARYFGPFNKFRRDRWVFGDRDSGFYLRRLAWTKIVRHQMVKGAASPDDPALAGYWAARRRKNPPPLDRQTLRLLQAQQGRCRQCGDYFWHPGEQPQSPQQWERWLPAARKAMVKQPIAGSGQPGMPDSFRLIHTRCYRRASGKHSPALPHACEPVGLA